MIPPLVARALSLAMAAAFSLASVRAHTQSGCRDECDTIPFGPPQRSVLRLSDECFVRITWTMRRSCRVGIDINVLAVEPLTDRCGTIPISRLVGDAADSLVASSETPIYWMGAPRDTCVTVGRVLAAACWRYDVHCGDTTAVPCDSTSCCESDVEMCTDVIFRRSIHRRVGRLRAPCDPRTGCPTICGEAPDTIPHDWSPGDTPPPGHDTVNTFSARPGDRDGEESMLFNRRWLPLWPWRDPRPVRHPVRETREERWRFALRE
jgi:hypothetical protein